MTKQQKLDAIYDTIVFNGKPFLFNKWWHIGDVLKYIDTNHCFIDDGEWHKSRDMEALDSMLRAVFYSFVGKQDRPIDEQDESCIDYVFSLIK